VSIIDDAKGYLLHGVARKVTPTLMSGSLEEPGRNGHQGSLQKAACKKPLWVIRCFFSWRGATVGPNRKIFCQSDAAVGLSRKKMPEGRNRGEKSKIILSEGPNERYCPEGHGGEAK
jgi:hypothetical protein